MSEVVDGRNDQLTEDSFVSNLDEQALDNDSVLEGLEDMEEEEQASVDDRHEGTDQVLARLTRTDPEAARSVRAMQQQMSRNTNEWRQMQSQMIDVLTELQGRREEEEESSAPEDVLPEGVTQEHLEMFQAMAKHFGYVPRQELESKELQSAQDTHAEAALRQGVEQYGEAFGTIGVDGEVVMNPETQERLAKALERISDPKRGLTMLELYRLEFGAQQRRQPRTNGQGPRQQPARSRAGVARRSTGGGQPVKIYDSKRGDSRDDVFHRAWALAMRELG